MKYLARSGVPLGGSVGIRNLRLWQRPGRCHSYPEVLRVVCSPGSLRTKLLPLQRLAEIEILSRSGVDLASYPLEKEGFL